MGGLLAIGRAGGWQLDLDEIHDEAENARTRWGFIISTKSFHLQLEIGTLEVLSELATLLALTGSASSEMYIGCWMQAKVVILSEEGRKQIRILPHAPSGTEWPALVEINLLPDQIKEFGDALRDLLKNLAG
jgi:hypothetical protein